MAKDSRSQLLAALRAKISEITARPVRETPEPAAAGLAPPPQLGYLSGTRQAHLDANVNKQWLVNYPLGADWLTKVPSQFVPGAKGYDPRLSRDLAGAGLFCYTPFHVTNRLGGTISTAIRAAAPVIADWLNSLEDKIPGPETHHRYLIRLGLILLLDDNGAKGSDPAVAALLHQLPPVPPQTYDPAYPALADSLAYQACRTLYRIVRKRHHDAVYTVMTQLSPQAGRSVLLECLAQFKDPRVVALATAQVQDPRMRQCAIRALGRAKAPGVRDLVANFAHDENYQVRNAVKIALKKLPP